MQALEMTDLRDMYVAELQELASVERQLLECLSRLVSFAGHPQLKNVLADQQDDAEVQCIRLDTLLEQHGANPEGHCDQTMQSLIYEMERMLPMLKSGDLRDVGLIGSLQRLKHYEIAAYGTAAALAHHLRLPGDERTLRQNLEEEKLADAVLSELAQREVNPDALAA
jgi:ferritin-like metal-binding protein YciE